MEKIRLCIAGVTGWVGKPLARAVINSVYFDLVGGVSRKSSGKDLGKILDIPGFSLIISESVSEALNKTADVLIDYTSPDIVKSNVEKAIDRGVNVVIGTSGLSDADYEEIDNLSRKKGVGVFAAGNYSVSAALALHFSEIAARFMKSWEIIDFASDSKIDSPSGTALELGNRLYKVKRPDIEIPVKSTKGHAESRGLSLNGIQTHSIRLPGYIIGAEVMFGNPDERLTIRFEGGSGAEPYIKGTLIAARKVKNMHGLVRGMDSLLEMF